ncbi:MAG TPA: alpha/beta fold hydrolase, partial [Verrucomicrobiae bacterium]|nr:alpha/beta fold hydrolase [Verrucomicrobiae bacterium]
RPVIASLGATAADGVATGARTAGSHGPALFFVHGVGSTAAIWDRQLEAFAGGYRCFAIELRGNGALADPPPEAISRAGYALDVLAVADAAGAERFTIVGCSLGGVVAFELLASAPQRVEAAVFVGSFARYPNAQAYADGIAAAVREAGDMRTFARARAAKLALPPERERETIEQMACKSLPCYLAATQATWTGDYRELLPRIAVPALVACGENDAVAPPELSREIAGGIPGASFVAIEGAGHVANADAPERFNAVLRAFLNASGRVP